MNNDVLEVKRLEDELAIAEQQLHLALSLANVHSIGEQNLTDPRNTAHFSTELSCTEELDARDDFCGHNWYHAEHDGRWAGRGTASTIYLRKLSAGTYKLSFTFARFIDVRFAYELKILLNGLPLATVIRGRPTPGFWRRLLGSPQSEVSCPVVYDAEVKVSEGADEAAEILTFVFPFARRPNEKDQRLLTARLRSVSINRLPSEK